MTGLPSLSVRSRSSGVELVLQAERRAGYLCRPMVCSWKPTLRAVPVFQRHADAADHQIAAAAHPGRPVVADPHDFVRSAAGVVGAVLEAHQIARRLAVGGARQEAGLRPAHLRHVVGEPGELAHGVERDLRVVGAGLDRQIAAGSRRHQLVAVEPRQIDQRLRPSRREAVAILAVLLEQPRHRSRR